MEFSNLLCQILPLHLVILFLHWDLKVCLLRFEEVHSNEDEFQENYLGIYFFYFIEAGRSM